MLSIDTSKARHILLVDDHPIVRVGYMALLKEIGEEIIFHEAVNAKEAIALVAQYAPGIALVDLSMAGMCSLDLIKTMRELSPGTAILVVSMHEEKIYAERALCLGARGYVMKQVAAKSIIQAVRTIIQGKIWLSEEFRQTLVDRISESRSRNSAKSIHSLSDREFSVFRLIGLGMKKTDIAKELNLSPNTVETHRSHIKKKLDVASGSELYRCAFLHFQAESIPRIEVP